jgi:prepilin-type N-terminal cleavage/methylation domain-containing protein
MSAVYPRYKAGFTLVELLIVIVVIAILAAITIVSYNGIRTSAITASIKNDLNGAAKLLENDKTINGTYPGSSALADSGRGLSSANNTALTYMLINGNYCVTATAGNISFYVSGATKTVTSGTCPIPVNGGVVSLYAGTGTTGYADGALASATFNGPYGFVFDTDGSMYLTESMNHRVRKISGGIVSTLAGNGTGYGTGGFADGTGAAAQFNTPVGIVVDGSHNVFVADYDNHRIRKITPSGVVTTFAGSGVGGFADGTGGAAQFNRPWGLAIDSNDTIYVADKYNHRIRKITSAGVVTTLAGSSTSGAANGTGGAATFYRPSSLAIDTGGILYLTEENSLIRKITPAGVVTTFAGSGTGGFADGTGTAAQFYYPNGIVIDPAGTLYVADTTNQRIRKITSAGVVTTLAGNGTGAYVNGTGTSAQLSYPGALGMDSDFSLYVGEGGPTAMYSRIRKIQ